MLHNAAVVISRLEQEQAHHTKMEALTKYFPSLKAYSYGFSAVNPLLEWGISDIDNAELREELYNWFADNGAYYGLDNTISLFKRGITAGVMATQPIYAGGRIVNGNALAAVGKKAASIKSEITVRDLLQSVQENYWLVVSLREKRNTVTEAIGLLDAIEHDLNLAIEAGLATRSDILKVKVRRGEMASNLVKLDHGITLATMNLCRESGVPYSAELCPLDTVPHLLESPDAYWTDPEEATMRRPEAELLDLSIKAEDLKRKMTIGEALPQIAVGGSISYANIIDKNTANALAFASVNIPILDWWGASHSIRKQSLEIEKARVRRDDLLTQMRLQCSQSWDQLLQQWDLVDVASLTVTDAESNMDNVRQNFSAGLATTTELLEAQTLLVSARESLTSARIDYILALQRYISLCR